MISRPTYRRKEFLKVMAGAAVAVPAARWLSSPESAEARATPIIRVHSINFGYTETNGAVSLTAGVRIVTGAKGVAGAQVTVRFIMPDGTKHQLKSNTGSDGIAKFAIKGQSFGAYAVEVVQVTRAGMAYRSSNNVVTRATLTVQEPVVEAEPEPQPELQSAPQPEQPQEPAPDGHINVRDYGVRGDGTTDDSPAIQQAVDAVARAGGGTLYFPAGTYKLGSTIWLESGVHLAGESRDSTELSANADMNILEIISKSDISVSNLTLRRTNSPQNWGYGVMVWDSQNLTFASSRFVDMPDAAIYLMRAHEITITSCEFANLRMTGVRLAPSGEGHANRFVRISNNVFNNVNFGRFDGHSAVHCHGGEPGVKNEYVWIEDNYIQSGGIGLGLDDIDHGVVARNRIVGSGISGEGIAFTGSNNRIVDNVVDNNYAAGILLWGVAYRSINDNAITGNTCWDNAQGIAVVCGGHGSVVENLEVSSNRCYAERSNSKQQFGIQHYIDGTQDFAWRNVRFVQNDLRGNTVWAWNIIPPAYAEFVDNVV